jgi:hypothetical protein
VSHLKELSAATERLKQSNDRLAEVYQRERGSVPPTGPELELTEADAVRIGAVVMAKAALFCAFSGVSPEMLLAFSRAAVRGVRT